MPVLVTTSNSNVAPIELVLDQMISGIEPLPDTEFIKHIHMRSDLLSDFWGEDVFGDRAAHCWNGDQQNGNHISRLRDNAMYVPGILQRIEAWAPDGADLTSWRY